MPNWCTNIVTIENTHDENFQDLINAMTAKGVGEGREYKWTTHLGEEELKGCDKRLDASWVNTINEEKVDIYLSTAWNEPHGWFEAISQKYPNLKMTLSYEEDGCCFFGFTHALEGTLDDHCFETPSEECSSLFKKKMKEEYGCTDVETAGWYYDDAEDEHCSICCPHTEDEDEDDSSEEDDSTDEEQENPAEKEK